jgi:hypothetical protein
MALSESNIFPEQSLQAIVSCISLDQADEMRSGETSNPENSLSNVSRLGRFLLGTSTKGWEIRMTLWLNLYAVGFV